MIIVCYNMRQLEMYSARMCKYFKTVPEIAGMIIVCNNMRQLEMYSARMCKYTSNVPEIVGMNKVWKKCNNWKCTLQVMGMKANHAFQSGNLFTNTSNRIII